MINNIFNVLTCYCCNNQDDEMNVEIDDLNTRWQKKFSQNVYDNPTIMTKEQYRFDDMVEKTKACVKDGKDLCLFIGRTPLEKLPSDRGEAKLNQVWSSVDNCISSGEKQTELIDSKEIHNRIYFLIDLNQQDALKEIEGLYKEVVIDLSTTKAFDKNFPKRFSRLLSSNDSKLIMEDPSQFSAQTFNTTISEFKFDPSRYTTTFNMMWAMKNKGNEAFEAYCLKIAKDETENHLKKLFNHVEKHTNEPFPYKSNWPDRTFYILKDPK